MAGKQHREMLQFAVFVVKTRIGEGRGRDEMEPRVAAVSVFMRGVSESRGMRGGEMAGADYLAVAALTPLPRETQPLTRARARRTKTRVVPMQW